MPEKNADHWLYRFDEDEWLRAAEAELARARAALVTRQHRAGVTQARRAAGMALNALLFRAADEERYGRSFMDHLHALAVDESVPEGPRAAARALALAPMQPALIPLGRGDSSLADAAASILAYARAVLSPTATA
jgi:HEPN domain-containing protein